MQVIDSVGELAGRYDAVLCDVWGVVHDGRTPFPGVADVLRGLRAGGVRVLLLTNVPRPSSTLPAALDRMGFPADAWDAIVTSGDVIRAELARRAPGPMHLLGRDTDRSLWEGLGLAFSGLSEARFVGVAGLRTADDTPAAYADALAAARARDLELLCANPDIQVMVGDRLVWCAGSIAAEYAALGGRVVQAGKPHPAIYERAYEVLAELAGAARPGGVGSGGVGSGGVGSAPPTGPDRRRILVIGDGIPTDIRGANRQGLDSVFVATGMHGQALLRDGEVDPARALAALDAAGASATFALTRLR